MKQLYLFKLSWLMSFVPLSCLVCRADTKVPCLIFSGNAEKERSIDLSKLNRITFGDNSMVISSSKDAVKESVELLYSLYHHLEIKDDIPNDLNVGISTTNVDSKSGFYFDAQTKLLYLKTEYDNEFSIGVFDINGHLLLTCKLYNGDAVTLEKLSSGVYIAVASDGNIILNFKFTLK